MILVIKLNSFGEKMLFRDPKLQIFEEQFYNLYTYVYVYIYILSLFKEYIVVMRHLGLLPNGEIFLKRWSLVGIWNEQKANWAWATST